jgi:hypothetical protein
LIVRTYCANNVESTTTPEALPRISPCSLSLALSKPGAAAQTGFANAQTVQSVVSSALSENARVV